MESQVGILSHFFSPQNQTKVGKKLEKGWKKLRKVEKIIKCSGGCASNCIVGVDKTIPPRCGLKVLNKFVQNFFPKMERELSIQYLC